MSKPSIDNIVVEALEEVKAQNITTIDVTKQSDIMDTLVIASGTSSRHVKSLADNVVQEAKEQGYRPIGVEGLEQAEWVLVDFGDTVVHVMLPATRDFYDLEKLWSTCSEDRKQNVEEQ